MEKKYSFERKRAKPMEINDDPGKAVKGRAILTTSHDKKLGQCLKSWLLNFTLNVFLTKLAFL